MDICLVVLSVWAIGAAIAAHEGNPVFGIQTSFLFGWERDQVPISAITLPLLASGVIAAAVGERSKFWPVCLASVLMGALALPLLQKWQFAEGWLGRLGCIDLLGANLLIASAVCAATGSFIVGARPGKYHRDGSSSIIPGHNVPMATAGVLMMVMGWVGCAGMFSTSAALNVLLAASAGAVASAVVSSIRFGKPDMLLCGSGLLAGALAGAAGADALQTPVAVLVGAISGAAVITVTTLIDVKFRIDDPSGLIAVYLVGPALGLLAAGLSYRVEFSRVIRIVGVQMLLIAVGALLSFLLSFLLFRTLQSKFGLRSSEADEYDGLDLAEHEINAYPDFQQTMIKSYHMREA